MVKLFLAMVLVCSFGCATGRPFAWVCPEKEQAQFEKEVNSCFYEVNLATPPLPFENLASYIHRKDGLLIQCMGLKGCSWEQLPSDGTRPAAVMKYPFPGLRTGFTKPF